MRIAIATFLALLTLTASAQAARAPDVRAVGVIAPSFAHSGGELSVRLTATAARRGVRPTRVRVYLSADRRRSKDDVRAGTSRLAAMKRGKRRTATVAAKVPASAAAGARYVIGCADDPGRIRERSERNNCRAAKGPVTIAAQADASKTSAALIEADRAAGKLSAEQALLYRSYAVLGDARLPARYRGDATAEEDDGALRELANAWPDLSKSTQRALSARGARGKAKARASQEDERGPCLTEMFIVSRKWKGIRTAGGKVRLHWPEDELERGKDAVQLAQDVAHAYALFKGVMGREPLSDGKSPCPHGEDGALDIYLMDVVSAAGLTIPADLRQWTSDFECNGFPSFIVADWSTSFTMRFTLAHELFHAFQNAFPYKGRCTDYTGFDEASANWAAHAAFPEDDSEHFFDFMMGSATGDSVDDRGYHGWPFVLWMAKTFGERSIRTAYEQFRSKLRAPGIDTAIGGFRSHLLDFVKHGWNQDPFATFKQWDRFENPAMKHFVPIPETHLFLAGQASRTGYVPASLYGRARDYNRYRITDEKVRELAFRNPLAGNPDFRVGALLTFADGSTRFDDWSGKDRVAFCRDNPAENVVSLVVMYGSSRVDDGRIEGTPELGMRDRCDGFPWHFKILNATLETRSDGGMTASGEHECDGFPIHGETVFNAATADDDFSLDHDVKAGFGGALGGSIATQGDAMYAYTLSGCEGDPLVPCSKAFERGAGKWQIGFTLDAPSPKADAATLSWLVADPGIGFVDYDDSVCNVQDIWHPLAREKTQQQVPLSWFAGTTPFILEFKGDDQFGEDQWGRPATLHYDWTYRMTIQRTDEHGDPL
ncbi:MAG TPA: hypothetical protein VK631_12830 [Solirubrobacteraceae bacterium]|nr:hypothetical protein [Solirubrobacteraceae bacterium]